MNECVFEGNEIEQFLNSNEPVSPDFERIIQTSLSFTNTPEDMSIVFPAEYLYNVLTEEQINVFWEGLTTVVYRYSQIKLLPLLPLS